MGRGRQSQWVCACAGGGVKEVSTRRGSWPNGKRQRQDGPCDVQMDLWVADRGRLGAQLERQPVGGIFYRAADQLSNPLGQFIHGGDHKVKLPVKGKLCAILLHLAFGCADSTLFFNGLEYFFPVLVNVL